MSTTNPLLWAVALAVATDLISPTHLHSFGDKVVFVPLNIHLCLEERIPNILSFNSSKHYLIFIIVVISVTERRLGNQKLFNFFTSSE